jgi:hypothetical protein
VIEKLDGMPEGVLGFEAGGKMTAEDYKDVLLPALEDAGKRGTIRCVLVVREFEGMSGGAVWEDLKTGMEYLRSWRRIALVTDIAWMTQATHLFGWMTPGKVRTFPLAQQAEAAAWAAEED